MARALLCLAALLVSLAPAPAQGAGPTKLRVATLAPKASAWGKVFRVWQKAVSQKSGGKLELEVFYNATMGNEETMVSKMKTGGLDGAALSSVGLSRIDKNVLVMQLPGVVDSWALLDKVRRDVGPELERRFQKHGFLIAGWGDLGLVRQMSRGFAARRPGDLKGHRPLVWRNEPMGAAIYASIGGIVPVPLSPTEVLPALRSGKIDVVSAPSLAAEQLQWTPYLDHISSRPTVCAIGGTVFRKDALDALPPDLAEVFWDIQRRSTDATKDRVRKLDEQAYNRLAKKMTVVDLSAPDREEWRKVLVPVIQKLGGGTFDKALVDRVVALSGKAKR